MAISKLEQLENIIQTNLESFIKVGEALLTIREEGLYKTKYNTFEKYIEEEWGFTGRMARNYIGAALISEPLGSLAPSNEGQARALGKFPQEHHATIMGMAQGYSTATGKALTAGMITRTGENVMEALVTGHVDTGSGTSSPVVASITAAEAEATKRQQEYIKDRSETHDARGHLTEKGKELKRIECSDGQVWAVAGTTVVVCNLESLNEALNAVIDNGGMVFDEKIAPYALKRLQDREGGLVELLGSAW